MSGMCRIPFCCHRPIQMEELERKLRREVTDAESQIIVCRFPLPNVRAHTVIGGGVDTVWVYDLHKQPPPETADERTQRC